MAHATACHHDADSAGAASACGYPIVVGGRRLVIPRLIGPYFSLAYRGSLRGRSHANKDLLVGHSYKLTLGILRRLRSLE